MGCCGHRYIEYSVAPRPAVQKRIFIVADADGIDNNPSLTQQDFDFDVSQQSLSDMQPNEAKWDYLQFGEKLVKLLPELPVSFKNIPSAFSRRKSPLPNNTETSSNAMNSMPWSTSPNPEFRWLLKLFHMGGQMPWM